MLASLSFILKVELGLMDFNQKKDFDQILFGGKITLSVMWKLNFKKAHLETEIPVGRLLEVIVGQTSDRDDRNK